MSRVALLLAAVLFSSVFLLAGDCTQDHVRSMEENNRGVDYYQRKLYSQAVAHLNRSVTIDDDNVQAHYNLALVYIATEQWEDSVRHLQRSIALNDGIADYHYKLGFALYQLNEFEQAVSALERAIALDATLYKAYYRLGLAYIALDRAQDALTQLTESINRNPRFIEGYRDLGSLYAELDYLPQAVQVFQSALEAVNEGSAEEAEIRHRLGTVLQEQRQFDEAVAMFRRSLEIDARQYDALFSLGWTYALMGQQEDARLHLRKFVNSASGNEAVRPDYLKAAQDKLFEFGENPMQ